MMGNLLTDPADLNRDKEKLIREIARFNEEYCDEPSLIKILIAMLEWDIKRRDDFEELFEKAKDFGWYDDM